MGIEIASWQQELISRLQDYGIAVSFSSSSDLTILKFQEKENLLLNLISIGQSVLPETVQNLQQEYLNKNIQLIQLWEDVWRNRPVQVLSRIRGLLGQNKKIHGRKTKVISITQREADDFFKQHHLQGSARAKHRYALTADGVFVAAATFSGKRNMTRKTEGYTSVELIRFATADGITVQGGLSKLIRHLIKIITPNDVMTYADLDWSYGKGYAKLGFELSAQTPATYIWLHKPSLIRYFPHRLPTELNTVINTLKAKEADAYLQSLQYVRIFNTGNLKYILYL